MKAPQNFGEIAVARLRRRLLEGAAEGSGNSGMIGRGVHTNDSAVHLAPLTRRSVFLFKLHLAGKRLNHRGSFVRA
jgi:hypothetical protein